MMEASKRSSKFIAPIVLKGRRARPRTEAVPGMRRIAPAPKHPLVDPEQFRRLRVAY